MADTIESLQAQLHDWKLAWKEENWAKEAIQRKFEYAIADAVSQKNLADALDEELAQLKARPPAPMDAIGSLLAEAMDAAVANGANSRSMPDEYVEIAAWLCGIPTPPLDQKQPPPEPPAAPRPPEPPGTP